MNNKFPTAQTVDFQSAEQLYTYMHDYYLLLDSHIDEYIAQNNLSVVCSKGCGICCYIKLDVNAHEIIYLAHYILNKLSPEMRGRVITDLQRSAAAIAPLSTKDHFLGRFKCGFLQDNSCAVHPARPAMCRKFNSLSLEKCQQKFADDNINPLTGPEDIGLDDSAYEIIKDCERNLKMAGYDSTVYEINQAVLMALEKKDCLKLWLAGEKILPAEVEAKKFSPATLQRILERRRSLRNSY